MPVEFVMIDRDTPSAEPRAKDQVSLIDEDPRIMPSIKKYIAQAPYWDHLSTDKNHCRIDAESVLAANPSIDGLTVKDLEPMIGKSNRVNDLAPTRTAWHPCRVID